MGLEEIDIFLYIYLPFTIKSIQFETTKIDKLTCSYSVTKVGMFSFFEDIQ